MTMFKCRRVLSSKRIGHGERPARRREPCLLRYGLDSKWLGFELLLTEEWARCYFGIQLKVLLVLLINFWWAWIFWAFEPLAARSSRTAAVANNIDFSARRPCSWLPATIHWICRAWPELFPIFLIPFIRIDCFGWRAASAQLRICHISRAQSQPPHDLNKPQT